MPTRRFATPRAPRPVLGYGRLRFQSAKPVWRWTIFVAGLWSWRGMAAARLAGRRAAFATLLAAMAGCSQIAMPDSSEPLSQPPYVSLAAKYLQSNLKDVRAYDGFAISSLRWVSTIKGWSWLACVRFDDHGHNRFYAIFYQDNAISDARYAVATETCEAQSYTPFDLLTGELGRPTPPIQQPIY
jgi:hypothetical protein